eukprot:13705773-Alexandrium_andersonii.AAC.1
MPAQSSASAQVRRVCRQRMLQVHGHADVRQGVPAWRVGATFRKCKGARNLYVHGCAARALLRPRPSDCQEQRGETWRKRFWRENSGTSTPNAESGGAGACSGLRCSALAHVPERVGA